MTPRDEDFIETPENYAGTVEPRLESQPLSEKSTAELEQEITQIRAEMDSTLSAIERRFSTGDLVDRGIHYLSGGPSEYAGNLARTMRDNPVPTTLFGIGLAWLMLGAAGQRAEAEGKWSSQRSKLAEGSSRRWREMSSSVSEKFHQVEEKMHGVGEKARAKREEISQRMQGTGEKARAKREEFSQRMHDTGEKARAKREEISQRMHGTGEKARAKREELSQRMHGTGERARQFGETTEKTMDNLRYKAERARNGFSYMMHEQPLLLATMGIGIGMLLGSILPVTRREEELVGQTAREMGAKAREKAQEGVEKARLVAEKTMETAREETERQFH